MQGFVAARGRKLEKLYFAYPTCPTCAKAYGKNYVLLLAPGRKRGAKGLLREWTWHSRGRSGQ